MWNLKQKADIKFLAYTPKGFEKLFFAADEIIEIPLSVNSFRFYSEVSEFVAQHQDFKSLVKQRVRDICRSTVYRLCKFFNIRNQFLSSLLILIPTYRARRYLFQSGVWSWCKEDFKLRIPSADDGVIFAAANHLSFCETHLCLRHTDLGESFKYLFGELSVAIENGIIDVYQSKYPGTYSPDERVVYLRTRNYRNKQLIHNTKSGTVIGLVDRLLQNGISVINIGSPALQLSDNLYIRNHDNYREFDNLLSIDDELTLLNGLIICGADAGLFVLMCCLPNPIICLTHEWSEFLGVKLMDARLNAGQSFDLEFSGDQNDTQIVDHILSML